MKYIKKGVTMAYLTPEQQQEIDKKVEEFKGNDKKAYPLIGLDDMAEQRGITVYEANLKEVDLEQLLGVKISDSLSGFISYDDPDNKTNPQIYIEKRMVPERKRFTLAHELGHHCLHDGVKLRLDITSYVGDDKDALEETEANYFAASLLMPKEIVKDQLKANHTVADVADFFKVSLSAARNRMQWVAIN